MNLFKKIFNKNNNIELTYQSIKDTTDIINKLVTISTKSPLTDTIIPHIENIKDNFTKILLKYPHEKTIIKNSMQDVQMYLLLAINQTKYRIGNSDKVYTAGDVSTSDFEKKDEEYIFAMREIRDRQKETLGDDYINFIK